uniref:TetR/AcrR family transcriptional regulator n=1 Tax=Phaeovulum sp. TaxID=2934796 RepID=UPI0035627A7A
LLHGFRGTTVEGIAEAAGISKVTLYTYFHDKDAAFEAVATRFFETLRKAAQAALAGPGTRSARVTAALIAKHGILFDTVRASAHAAELLATRAQVAARLDAFGTGLIAALGDVLEDAQAGRILYSAAFGISDAAATREDMAADIARLVAAMVPD